MNLQDWDFLCENFDQKAEVRVWGKAQVKILKDKYRNNKEEHEHKDEDEAAKKAAMWELIMNR